MEKKLLGCVIFCFILMTGCTTANIEHVSWSEKIGFDDMIHLVEMKRACLRFHRITRRWPKDKEELRDFLKRNEWEDFLAHYKEVTFQIQDDGRLSIQTTFDEASPLFKKAPSEGPQKPVKFVVGIENKKEMLWL